MINQNLKPFNTMTVEEQRIIQRKGGSQRTPAKTLAAKLRELKKKGLTDAKSRELYEVLTSPELSALDLRLALERIRSLAKEGGEPGSALTTNQKIEVWKGLHDLHKSIHGTKINISEISQSVNLDIQTSLSADDIATIVQGRNPPEDFVDAPGQPEPL